MHDMFVKSKNFIRPALISVLFFSCSDETPVPAVEPVEDNEIGQAEVIDDADHGGTVQEIGDEALFEDEADMVAHEDVEADSSEVNETQWGCVPHEAGLEICDNGLDDDCDGYVDEACGCAPAGEVQSCYLGTEAQLSAPNSGCQAGVQECGFEFWGPCEGATGPIAEVCHDDIDNDCDGEVDEECGGEPPIAICPADFAGPVLNAYHIQGGYEDINGEPMTRATWDVRAPPGHSYDLTYDADGLGFTFFADVAGEYRFILTVSNVHESDHCETIFNAETADMLRVELFWNPDFEDSDESGIDCTDLDLYIHSAPESGDDWGFFRPSGSGDEWPNVKSCNWQNCATCDVPYSVGDAAREHQCREFLIEQSELCDSEDICPLPNDEISWGDELSIEDDPRLDLDDVEGHGPENINVRLPEAGIYRIAAHYYDPDNDVARGCALLTESEVFVRVLCGGVPVYESEGVYLLGHQTDPEMGHFWDVGLLQVDYDLEGHISCDFADYGSESCRMICLMSESDGGCSNAEARNIVGDCVDG